jgi:hypothetical protein
MPALSLYLTWVVAKRNPFWEPYDKEDIRMRGSRCGAALLALAAILFVSVSAGGCTARVRYYDEEHHDYHRWNNHEVVVYHSYWDGRHQP